MMMNLEDDGWFGRIVVRYNYRSSHVLQALHRMHMLAAWSVIHSIQDQESST
jgi:hypothetical protein